MSEFIGLAKALVELQTTREGGGKQEGPTQAGPTQAEPTQAGMTPYQQRHRRCWTCKEKGHSQTECPVYLEKMMEEATGDKDFRTRAPPQSKASSSSSVVAKAPPPPFSKASAAKPPGELFFKNQSIILRKKAPAPLKIQKAKK